MVFRRAGRHDWSGLAVLTLPCLCRLCRKVRAYERSVDEVLGEEPGLDLTGADDSGDDQVIGAVVARPCGTGGVLVGVDEYGFVNFQQPRQHGRDFLGAVRRAGDAGDLSDVTRVADSHTP